MPAESKNDDVDKLVREFKQDHPGGVDDDGNKIMEETKPHFVDWAVFNVFIGLVITANAVTIGLEIAAHDGEETAGLWMFLEFLFCFIFVAELVLRLYFHRWEYFGTLGNYKKIMEIPTFARPQYGNIFDFVVVLIGVLDTFILMPLGLGGEARFATFLRFLRLMRLVRLVRLFRIFKQLWLVAMGLLNAMKTLVWVCVILALFIEIGAIVTTRVIGHNDALYDPYFKSSGGWDHEIYFKTVTRSMFTLFQVVTLDSWSDDIVRHVGKQQPGMLAFFIAFIAVSNFGILNVIVGVVIESTIRTAEKDQSNEKETKEKERLMVFNQLREIFEAADTDGSGTLNLGEVVEVTNKHEVYTKLKMIEFPVDEPEKIFSLLDWDKSGELTIEEFITGCIRMKGDAKSKDLLVAQEAVNAMRRHFDVFDAEATKLIRKIRRLHETTRALTQHGEHIFLSTREYRLRHPDVMEATIPHMASSDLMQAPWMKEHNEGSTAAGSSTPSEHMPAITNDANGRMPAISNNPAHPALPSAHSLDAGRNNAQEQAALMLADRKEESLMLKDALSPKARGKELAIARGNNLAIVQVPGAMPPEQHGALQ